MVALGRVQTDEEKQRERQRNEREQKNAELEALQMKVSLHSGINA